MAYNGKHVGISRIIENAYRNSGYDMIDWEAAIEWTAALMRIIGVSNAYVSKNTNGADNNYPPIEITGYRGILPKDLVVRGMCRRVELDDDRQIIKMSSMQESTDVFFKTHTSGEITNPVFFDPLFNTVRIDENGESENITLTQSPTTSGVGEVYTYKVDNEIIFTNFETGYVEMEYKGFPTDENGLPMIPDDEKYIRAIMWEIISNLDRLAWRKSPATPGLKAVLNDSTQERDWAVASARTKAKIPTVDELESIKKMWLRSIPKVNEHGTNFSTLGAPEVRYNQNRRLWRTRH